jgi:ubiquinone/menaquinone biosynthesis C-methylase UbiE
MADDMKQQTQDWGNYWQGRAGREGGAALVGVGVETDAEIGAFWAAELEGSPPDSRLLDLACGAGSVGRRAFDAGLSDVSGLDISSEAIRAMQAAFPRAKGFVAPADSTGLTDGSFDIVASQFGFEYANPVDSAGEAARVLAAGGRFIALAHAAGSGIEREVAANGAAAQSILSSGFIASASAVFEADLKDGSDAAFASAAQVFSGPQKEVLELGKTGFSLAANLYQGTQTLYQRRKAYQLSDITQWLSAMEVEIEAYIGRMESMRRAALSRAQAEAVLGALERGGMTPQPLSPFMSKAKGESIGWVIKAANKGERQ